VIMGDRLAQTMTIQGTDSVGFFGQRPTGRSFRIFIVRLYIRCRIARLCMSGACTM
jgi:hypothetical protein